MRGGIWLGEVIGGMVAISVSEGRATDIQCPRRSMLAGASSANEALAFMFVEKGVGTYLIEAGSAKVEKV